MWLALRLAVPQDHDRIHPLAARAGIAEASSATASIAAAVIAITDGSPGCTS